MRVRRPKPNRARGESRRIAGLSALLIALSFAAVACSTEEPLPPRGGEEDTPETSRRVGSLLAEFERGSDGLEREVSIHAQFLDVRGVRVDEALDALEVWSADTDLDQDACTMLPGSSAPTAARDRDVRLDLLSVGAIDVEGPRQKLELQARRLPDLLSAFSGVIYGTDRSFGDEKGRLLEFKSGAEYSFRAPGDGSTGGFDVSLEAPTPVGFEPVSAQWTASENAVALERGEAFDFRWRATSGSRTDLFFDIATGYGPDQPRMKCRLEDDGHFSIPADLIAELADESSTLRASMRRVSRRDVDIAGLERAEFSLSTVDRLTLELY